MLEAVAISAGLVFLAEIGDKSQLLAMSLAARYRIRSVLLGTALAIIVLNLLSALAGEFLGNLLPDSVVRIGAGILFLAFALISWYRAWKLEPESADLNKRPHGKTAVATVFLAFTVAELGDKTMLTAMALSTQYAWYWIWVGSSIGMMASIGLAVWIGQMIVKVVPVRLVHILAGAAFATLGGAILLV